MKPLFICSANVGRSQMAEGYFNALTNTNEARSAGIYALVDKYSHPSNDIIAVMAEEGIDISQQMVKQLTDDMVDKAEKVVVLCSKNDCPVELRIKRDVLFREIEDPYGYGVAQLRRVRNEIKEVVLSLLRGGGF